ncbi:hypothetical protein [Streptomyces sp. NBC_00286]|uniref:hypothetical protein n=1 Tax=Streptomyces sp. NBC_00286 TaxID=2975701 RepID=UPI002E291881|nr:hypothetical protein [Streptomyces sp. NBC_00286]
MSLVPPPFDPELAAVLEVVAETLPSTFTIDMVAAARQGMAAARPGPEALDQDGLFEVEDRIVPGPEGAPDISLLIARPPNHVTAPDQGVYVAGVSTMYRTARA